MNKGECDAAAKELQALGVASVGIVCDVSSAAAVEALFKQTVAKFGKLDALVNNAGIYPFVPFDKMTEADWDKVMAVNLKSVFLCSHEAAKVLPPGGPDRERLIGRLNGRIRRSRALLRFKRRHQRVHTRSRARARAAQDHGERSGPGRHQHARRLGRRGDEQTKQTVALIPLARMGEPADIANARRLPCFGQVRLHHRSGHRRRWRLDAAIIFDNDHRKNKTAVGTPRRLLRFRAYMYATDGWVRRPS